MTEKASPNEPTDLARFLQDWTALWLEELQAQAGDPERMPQGMPRGMPQAIPAGLWPGMPKGAAATGAATGMMSADMSAAMETWRAAMLAWIQTMGVPPLAVAAPNDSPASPRAPASVAAPDPRDAEIERLTRRIDALEARLAKLEPARRGRR